MKYNIYNDEFLNLVLNRIEKSIFLVNKEDKIIYCNEKSLEEFTYSFSGLKGKKVNEILQISLESSEDVKQVLSLSAIKKNGKKIFIKMNTTVLKEGVKYIEIEDISRNVELEKKYNLKSKLEDLIIEISLNFISLNYIELKKEIRLTLKEINNIFNLDGVILYTFKESNKNTLECLEYYAEETEEISKYLTLEKNKFQWFFNIIENLTSYKSYNVSSIPEAGRFEKKILEGLEIKSIEPFPLKEGKETIGVLMFFSKDEEIEINSEIKDSLKNLTSLFVKILNRKMNEDNLMEESNTLLEFNSKLALLQELSILDYNDEKKIIIEYLKKGMIIFGSEYAFFFNNEKNELFLFDEEMNRIELKVNTFIENVVRQVKTYTSFIDESDKFLLGEMLGIGKIKELILCPVQKNKGFYGVLSFFSTELEIQFKSSDIALIELMTKGLSALVERKENRELLLSAKEKAEESSKMKGEFLANMSHELRTPLNSIIGFSELLLDEESNREKNDTLKIILKSSKNLLELINGILDITKIDSGKMELHCVRFYINDLIKDLKDMFYIKIREKDLDFVVERQEKIPPIILGDDLRIKQVLVNLISNAIKFTEFGKIELKFEKVNKYLKIDIIDTGAGIEKEKQGKIFEEFTQADTSITRKYGGTGLGLAITKRIVALMNGKIELESEVNVGTKISVFLEVEFIDKENAEIWEEMVKKWLEEDLTRDIVLDAILKLEDYDIKIKKAIESKKMEEINFLSHKLSGMAGNLGMLEIYDCMRKIELETNKDIINQNLIDSSLNDFNIILKNIPKKYKEKTEKIEKIKTNKKIKKRFNILAADDNEHNRLLIKRILEKEGFDCELVENGKEVVKSVRENSYDLLLLDIHMPIMGGIEAIERIKQEMPDKNLYIIVLSADAIKGKKEYCLKIGADDYLSKPLHKDKFVYKLNTVYMNYQKLQEKNSYSGEKVLKIIEALKENLLGFDEDELIELAEGIEEESLKDIKNKIIEIASTYDDELLERYILELEAIVNG